MCVGNDNWGLSQVAIGQPRERYPSAKDWSDREASWFISIPSHHRNVASGPGCTSGNSSLQDQGDSVTKTAKAKVEKRNLKLQHIQQQEKGKEDEDEHEKNERQTQAEDQMQLEERQDQDKGSVDPQLEPNARMEGQDTRDKVDRKQQAKQEAEVDKERKPTRTETRTDEKTEANAKRQRDDEENEGDENQENRERQHLKRRMDQKKEEKCLQEKKVTKEREKEDNDTEEKQMKKRPERQRWNTDKISEPQTTTKRLDQQAREERRSERRRERAEQATEDEEQKREKQQKKSGQQKERDGKEIRQQILKTRAANTEIGKAGQNPEDSEGRQAVCKVSATQSADSEVIAPVQTTEMEGRARSEENSNLSSLQATPTLYNCRPVRSVSGDSVTFGKANKALVLLAILGLGPLALAGLGLHQVYVEGRGRSLQGKPYSLDCVITPASASNTTSAFVWRRDSKLLDHHTGPVLPFTRLSKLDEGNYQCGLDSGDTEMNQLSGPYFLRVTVFENLSLVPEVEVEEGQTAILNCSVLSDPTAFLTWRLDGKDVRTVKSNSDSLVLHNASRLHLTVVQCQAYNEALVMGFMTAYSLIRTKVMLFF